MNHCGNSVSSARCFDYKRTFFTHVFSFPKLPFTQVTTWLLLYPKWSDISKAASFKDFCCMNKTWIDFLIRLQMFTLNSRASEHWMNVPLTSKKKKKRLVGVKKKPTAVVGIIWVDTEFPLFLQWWWWWWHTSDCNDHRIFGGRSLIRWLGVKNEVRQ